MFVRLLRHFIPSWLVIGMPLRMEIFLQEITVNLDVAKAVIEKTGHWVGKLSQRARKPLVLLSALVCAVSLASTTARAQLTTADIIGNVYDSSGAVLPNAKVTLTNEKTREIRTH
jgi:hypothetical protein